MNQTRLAISPLSNRVYTAKMKDQGNGKLVVTGQKTDVTEDFLRCVVRFSNEVTEFEVDGLTFRISCKPVKGEK